MANLSEALKASKIREALGVSRRLGKTDILAAYASDTYVTLFYNKLDEPVSLEKSWSNLLPDERQLIFQLDWEPVSPKDPLTQLAESLTDWCDEEDG